MSWHFEKSGIMFLNLVNTFVFEEKAPSENPATLLGVLLSVSVTSTSVALSVTGVSQPELNFERNQSLFAEMKCSEIRM